jgi:hypothetical protein
VRVVAKVEKNMNININMTRMRTEREQEQSRIGGGGGVQPVVRSMAVTCDLLSYKQVIPNSYETQRGLSTQVNIYTAT